jgi:hypothetical protein
MGVAVVVVAAVGQLKTRVLCWVGGFLLGVLVAN